MSAAPAPLRALIAWPEPVGSALARGLRSAGVDVTPADDLAGYLTEPGYYHVAYASLAEWRGYSARKRAALGGRVRAIILGPGPATAADCAGAPAALYLPAALPPAECVALFAALHEAVAQGWSFAEVAEKSGGRLAFAGAEPPPQASPAAPPAASPATVNGQAVSIGAGSRAIYVNGQYVENQTIGPGAGLAIGHVTVEGDVVQGNKTVQHAEGDQFTVNRGAGAGAAPAPAPTCHACGAPVTPSKKFCGQCGTAQ